MSDTLLLRRIISEYLNFEMLATYEHALNVVESLVAKESRGILGSESRPLYDKLVLNGFIDDKTVAARTSLEDQTKIAEQFAKDNLPQLCRELIEWEKTALLGEGKLRELQALCGAFAGEQQGRSLATSMVNRAAVEKACAE